MRRYYLRQLLQGVLLFIFAGGLLLLLSTSLEYFLWMDGTIRAVLFWTVVFAGLFLFARFLLLPVLRLFRIREGISRKQGSRMIGKYFPEVGDRLLNLLDLAEQPEQTELLLASIRQRSDRLKHVPFARAISMKSALKYARLALIPIGIAGLVLLAGKGKELYDSYTRMVNYQVAYERPAPFRFDVMNRTLRVPENQGFSLKVRTTGMVQPEQVNLWMEGASYAMTDKLTHHEYTFRPPLQNTTFRLEASGVYSGTYRLEVIRVPLIDRFSVLLEYPDYLRKPPQRISGTGNLTVPEGSKVTWDIRAVHTDTITYQDPDTLLKKPSTDGSFRFGLQMFRDKSYTISTSNKDLPDYETLRYAIEVIRDEPPKIRVQMSRDSLNPNLVYFAGELADDYGLTGLRVQVWETGRDAMKREVALDVPGDVYHTFFYTFPSGFSLDPGTDYEVQFEVRDNDGIRGGKRVKSEVFSLRQLTAEELEREKLQYQKSVLGGISKARKAQIEVKEGLDAFRKEQREAGAMDYNDMQQLQENIERQLQQEDLMKKFSRDLKESLEEEEEDPFREILRERLERQEARAKRNAELMKEMKEVLDKLNQEELEERLDELGKQQNSNERSLEQLLELTKRYYVEQQAGLLARRLQQLSAEQRQMAEKPESAGTDQSRLQESLNRKFDSLRPDLEQLERDNQALKKPLRWKRDREKEEAIDQDQEEALQAIQKNQTGREGDQEQGSSEQEKTRGKQNSAARKMEELAESLRQKGATGGEGMAEDAETLRQILDNLIIFSFEEEDLFDRIQKRNNKGVFVGGDIRKQQELREMFEHVDDSLFALSLRQPEISENINEEIEEVYYNIDKSLESLSENRWYRGASYQQYAITASNTLAAMLAETLENMQESLRPGKGQGGGDFQLPDIIQRQEGLGEMMNGQQQGGEKDPEGQGSEQGEQGQGQQQGAGQDGAAGGEGKKGKGSEGAGGQGQKTAGEQGQGSESGGKRSGKGKGQGQGNDGQNGSGGQGGKERSAGDLDYGEIFEIYKEQQRIRLQLEKQLQDMIKQEDRELGERIAREMEQFENELLRSGVTERSKARFNQIRQKLMQLENASFEQEKDDRRESQTNTEFFQNPVLTIPERMQGREQNTEILNKQVLPLRLIYKQKVKTYFQNEEGRLPL